MDRTENKKFLIHRKTVKMRNYIFKELCSYYMKFGNVLQYNHCESFIFAKRKMPRAGIEPATRGFSVLCSTN